MCVLGIDPGASGGLAGWSPDLGVTVHPFRSELEFLEDLESYPRNSVVFIEDLPRYVPGGTSATSWFKLGYNAGFEMGVCRAFGLSVRLVKPTEWQKGVPGLKPKMGYTARKRALRDEAARRYPNVKVTHAVADALLIMDYGRARAREGVGP